MHLFRGMSRSFSSHEDKGVAKLTGLAIDARSFEGHSIGSSAINQVIFNNISMLMKNLNVNLFKF